LIQTPDSNRIYVIQPSASAEALSLEQVWSQTEHPGLASGYTNLVPAQLGERLILFCYSKAAQQMDTYELCDNPPGVQPLDKTIILAQGPWDEMDTFTVGNVPYMLTYRAEDGTFGFYHISADLSVSPPYTFTVASNTPTQGFTTMAPFTSLGGQYILAYNLHDGTAANFSVTVTTAATGDIPPLMARNTWYHHWAKNWMHFVLFQMGNANFFFKINLGPDPQNQTEVQVHNVNIDHIQDNPAFGTVEVGSHLQGQLPEAATLDIVARIPWAHGEPYLLTYIARSGSTALYRIHADCQGWTQVNQIITVEGAERIVPYRLGDTTYVLFYGGDQRA
jgi:hypothetical protein